MNSLWSETTSRHIRPPLEQDTVADVLIIGGGISGILAAHKLREAGVRCIVVEGKTVGSGITKNTTAKITAQHGLIYAGLIKRRGLEFARQFYEVNTRAIQQYYKLSKRFSCDFEKKTAYVYSKNDRHKIEIEANAYAKLGIKARIEENLPLPFSASVGLAMDEQAQFHPLKLLFALAEELEIYENTFVGKIDNYTAYLANGAKIKANHIIICTHYPMVNVPGLYFLKLFQNRSYVIALEGAPSLDGMYIDEREGGNSFRTYGNLLFVGGGGHKTGKTGGGYAELEALTKQAYPSATIKYRWAAQDCMSLDGMPYIGLHRAGQANIYTATGFNKWGMTGAMVASEIFCDLIVEGKSELKALYSPQRSIFTPKLFTNIGAAAKGLLSVGGPRCAHMGCKLHWNSAEKSWDCACHGSRFCESGHIIDNPAKKDIKR